MHGGGCERVIAQLANWFIENNINCTIITEVNEPCFYSIKKEVKIISLSSKSRIGKKGLLGAYTKMRKLIKGIDPDVVLSMPEKVNVWTALSLVGTGIPRVVSERNNPAIYPPSKIKRIIRQIIYPTVNGFIFQTKEASEFFSRRIQHKGIILPNPLDPSRIPQNIEEVKRKEIVSIGRLEKQKNHHLLIDAFSKFQKNNDGYELIIYGEGSLRNELETYAEQKLKKNTYSFPGKKSDVLERITGASLFVLSSNYEGMPNALIEAMAIGLPVISTNCPAGGPNELITSGENGLLVSVGNTEELTKAMEKVVREEEFATKIANEAREIINKLDINLIANKWLSYLESVSNKK